MTATKLPTLKQVEKALGEKAAAWSGRCFEIASKVVQLELVPGVAVYGHFRGEIQPKSVFNNKRHLGWCQHGWVRMPDGRVFDPTRWVFEAKPPYLYVGPELDEYDEGGNKLRAQLAGSVPVFDPDERLYNFPKAILPSAAWTHAEKLLEIDLTIQEPGVLSLSQVQWLAHADFAALQPHAHAIYEAITAVGREALIPIDNRRRAAREANPLFRIVRVTQSPMNKARWCLELFCGHEVWVTAARRPKVDKPRRCDTCEAACKV